MKSVKGTFMRAMTQGIEIAQDAKIYEGVFAVYKLSALDGLNWHLDHAPTGKVMTRTHLRRDCLAKVKDLLEILDWDTDSYEELTRRMKAIPKFSKHYFYAIGAKAK